MDSIVFESNEIFEINGSSKAKFSGEFRPDALADKLIEEWIPYYECHKCGKGDYCKYAIPHSANPLRKLDIKCGVAKEALRNFVHRTIFVLEQDSWIRRQKYLDAAFYFYKYVIESEQWNGTFIDNAKLDWWGEYSKKFFGEIIPIRDTLNELGNCLKEFPELYEGTSILLVEGEAEMTFISNLKGDGEYSNIWRFVVDSYGGKSNKLPRRIKMLLDDYKDKGYTIYIQGDEDGTGNGTGCDKFVEYVNQNYLDKNRIFQFQYDFETSIPLKLLYQVLIELGYLESVTLDSFINKLGGKSVNKGLLEHFDIDTEKNGLKKKIARIVGNAIFHIDHKVKDKFNETELGRFVLFLENIQ